MQTAIDAVKSSRKGVNRAALEFSVPHTILKDRITGRVVHGTKSGPKPYLTQQEEKELVDFLVRCSEMGYGKMRGEVHKIVEAIAKKKELKLKSVSRVGGGAISGKDGLNYPFVRVICFHKYALK